MIICSYDPEALCKRLDEHITLFIMTLARIPSAYTHHRRQLETAANVFVLIVPTVDRGRQSQRHRNVSVGLFCTIESCPRRRDLGRLMRWRRGKGSTLR